MGGLDTLVEFVIATALIGLRVGPVFAFAPPFTLMRIPVMARVLLSLMLSASLVGLTPLPANLIDPGQLAVIAAGELVLGLLITLSLQIVFGAMLFVGRALDFQAGFALALLADPSLRGQMPLIGSLFAYTAAVIFFLIGGPYELLAIWQRSVLSIPLGAFSFTLDIAFLMSVLGQAFSLAVGLAGALFLTLFLTDMTIAFLSRTLPQMNALLLGFQAKTIAILFVLPIIFAVSGTVFLRLLRLAFDSAAILSGGAP